MEKIKLRGLKMELEGVAHVEISVKPEWDAKYHYVECICGDLDHVTRIIYMKEFKEFYIEYRLARFPGEDIITHYKQSDSKLQRKFKGFIHNLKRVACYFKNIFWAIKGRPVWFTGQATWKHDEAQKLIDFIQGGINDQKRA
jgi:hypothetical protein